MGPAWFVWGNGRPRHGVLPQGLPGRGRFLPLTVDYRESTYAGGRIPGGWFKREGRPTEKEILTSRLIDRPLRPLFPKGYTQETQSGSVLSAEAPRHVLAINGASAALMVWAARSTNPSAQREWLWSRGGSWPIRPTSSVLGAARDRGRRNQDAVVMVEAAARGVSEAQILDAIDMAHARSRRSSPPSDAWWKRSASPSRRGPRRWRPGRRSSRLRSGSASRRRWTRRSASAASSPRATLSTR